MIQALASSVDMNVPEEGWVVCRVFKKKNYQKAFDSPRSTSTSTASMDSKIQMLCSNGNHAGVLDQILSYMGKTACKVERGASLNLKYHENTNDTDNGCGNTGSNSSKNRYQLQSDIVLHQEGFMHLPRLENMTIPHPPPPPPISSNSPHFDNCQAFEEMMLAEPAPAPSSGAATPDNSELLAGPGRLIDWAVLDQIVASQLNGQTDPTEPSRPYCCFGNNEDDLHQLHQARLHRVNDSQSLETLGCDQGAFYWSSIMAKSSSSSSSSDPLRHLSV